MNEILKEQMDDNLMEFIDLCFPPGEILEREKRLSEGDYLAKGIRIESLAREKQKKESVQFFEEDELNIFDLKLSSEMKDDLFQRALVKIEKDLKAFARKAESIEHFIQSVLPVIDAQLGIYQSEIDVTLNGNELGDRLCRIKGSYSSVKLLLKDAEGSMVLYGPLAGKGRVRKGFWHFKNTPKYCAYLGSAFEILAFLILLGKLQESFWEKSRDKQGRVYGLVSEMAEDITKYDYYLGELRDEEFEKMLLLKGYQFDSDEAMYKKNGNTCRMCMDMVLSTQYPIGLEYEILSCLLDKKKIPLKCLFRRVRNSNIGYDGFAPEENYVLDQIFDRVYLVLYEEYGYYADKLNYMRKVNKKIATAYITKKNIPQKIVEEMERSMFNKCFGYVEYDEDIDIKAVDKVAQEFLDLNERLFGALKHEDCSIRIRKLGKHKASGLYFPHLNCMCVDLRKPDSFCHEYYHLLDDHMGASSQYKFYPICREYERLIRAEMDSDENLKKALSKDSKYNLKYYLHPTEIFARCGEVYLQRIKGVKSSLLKPTLDEIFAYPVSDEFDAMVKEYYDAFHRNLLKTA